ncbi:MAG TPA: pseudouridine synthase [Chloroflexota bacterium]|nr:pseudouridine synthase [Chloroflexota bacterium]
MAEASIPPQDSSSSNGDNGRLERLHKVLAHAGLESRRAAEEMIAAGRVSVNGKVITTLGTKVDAERDVITVDNKPIPRRVKKIYLMLNKPPGYITTVNDPEHRPTVMELVPHSSRIYPVGRLDANSEGLILMTNDGEFANLLAHPRYSYEKEYHVAVPGTVSEEDLRALREGVEIEGGRTSPAQVRVLSSDGKVTWLSMTIHEGRNRQIRRMLHALGYRVERLVRMRVGPLWLGSLPRGSYRYLTPAEIRSLKRRGA